MTFPRQLTALVYSLVILCAAPGCGEVPPASAVGLHARQLIARIDGIRNDTTAVEAVREFMQSGEDAYRVTIEELFVAAIAEESPRLFRALGAPVIPAMRSALGSDDGNRRLLAVETLGVLAIREAVPEIRPLLMDRDHRVRYAACAVLGELGDRKSAPLIAQRALADPFPLAAIRSLGILAVPGTDATLVQLTRHDDYQIRAAALIALSSFPDLDLSAVIAAGATDPVAYVRTKAAEAIGRQKRVTNEPIALTMLTDGDWRVRAAAATTLGKLGGSEAGEPLIALLSDERSEVRGEAAMSLAVIGYRKALPELVAHRNDPTEWGLRRIVTAIGILGGTAEIPLLQEFAQHPHPRIREAAIAALQRLGANR